MSAVKQQIEYLEVGKQRVPLRVRRNRRARRIYLRYSPAEHGFALTLPYRTSLADGVDFIQSKQDWVVDILRQMPRQEKLRDGLVLPVLGQATTIRHIPEWRSPTALIGDELHIGGRLTTTRITEALKKAVRQEIVQLAHDKADQLGQSINRITLRDTRSRWGSCSTDHNLMFSWRLVFAPYEVLDYVVAHEVAHLVHMDHSPAFWRTVQRICPDYLQWKDWLRDHGKELYRFTS